MAGGGSSTQASRSGRKSLDAEINLVPFIDLLSMCICFLLMTAVWIEIGAVQVKQSHGTDAAATASDSLEMDLKFSNASTLELLLKKAGRAVKKISVKGENMTALLAKLEAELSTITSPVSAAMLTPSGGVSYGDLVNTMDVLRRHQIINLGIVPVRGGDHASH